MLNFDDVDLSDMFPAWHSLGRTIMSRLTDAGSMCVMTGQRSGKSTFATKIAQGKRVGFNALTRSYAAHSIDAVPGSIYVDLAKNAVDANLELVIIDEAFWNCAALALYDALIAAKIPVLALGSPDDGANLVKWGSRIDCTYATWELNPHISMGSLRGDAHWFRDYACYKWR